MMSPLVEKMVRSWGEMATRWGISRSVAQVHALLHFSAKPVAADEMVEALGIARSNVSACVRELQGWGVIRTVHLPGDRRDHFESIADPWKLFEVLLDERKRREVDPMLAVLREAAEETKGEAPETCERVSEMLGFLEQMDSWYQAVRKLPLGARVKLVKAAGKLSGWLGLGGGRSE